MGIITYITKRIESLLYVMNKDISEGNIEKNDFNRGYTAGQHAAYTDVIKELKK
jgi:hypothetical protein